MGNVPKRDKELRFGVIGLGRACTSFLPSLVRHPHITITAGADPRPEARAKWEVEFGAEVFENAEELCKSPNVDAVYIATPHALHASLVICAAENGKHAIVEKPMALTLEDCDRMIEAVNRAGTQLVIGPSHGFDPPIMKMRELIKSGEFGRVQMIHTFNYKNFMYIPLRRDEMDASKGGGAVFNQGAHQIDIVRWLGGGLVQSVRAIAGIYDPDRSVEGAFTALLQFANGSAATILFNGYGRFDSDEFHSWIGEGGMPKQPGVYTPGRKGIKGLTEVEEEALKAATGYGGSRQRKTELHNGEGEQFHPHFGETIVSCERGDMRPSPKGIYVFDNEKKYEVSVPFGLAGKSGALDELYNAVVYGIPAIHNGFWGKANVEITLAILESSKKQREITLFHQVSID